VSAKAQQGACRCGATRFAVSGAPLLTFACHCTGCRRMTAAPFSLSSLYPAERFDLVEGETVPGGLKGETRHNFCPSCMSWLFTVPAGMDAYVNIRSAMLDEAAAHRPFLDMWRSEGLAWADSGAERGYDTVPNEDEFSDLMAAYSAWDGRVKE
jgi:hypothetical protein